MITTCLSVAPSVSAGWGYMFCCAAASALLLILISKMAGCCMSQWNKCLAWFVFAKLLHDWVGLQHQNKNVFHHLQTVWCQCDWTASNRHSAAFGALLKGTTAAEMFQNLSATSPLSHFWSAAGTRTRIPPAPSPVCCRWFGYRCNYVSSCANRVKGTKQIKSQSLTKIYTFAIWTEGLWTHPFIRSSSSHFVTL